MALITNLKRFENKNNPYSPKEFWKYESLDIRLRGWSKWKSYKTLQGEI